MGRDASDTGGDAARSAEVPDAEHAHVQDLLTQLRALYDDVDSPEARAELQETKDFLHLAGATGMIDSGVRRLDRRDAGEALVGSIIFAAPLLVEGGIADIAAHLVASRVAGLPLFLAANVAFVCLMTYALVEWTGRDRTDEGHLFGVVPTRVLMILVISFLTAAVLLTVWGRVDDWQNPAVALSRVVVIWTVGALGAALGDIVSGDDPTGPTESIGGEVDLDDAVIAASESPGTFVAELDDHFDDVYETLDLPENRERLRRIEASATEAAVDDDGFGDEITKYTSRDVAEGFVGSVFFSIPLLVEDGVFDVAAYFLSLTVGAFPVVFFAHTVFVLGTVAAILYWTGPQDVRVTRPIFGFIPRRLLGIAVVSFVTAAALMTMWGRVAGWTDPVVALARISAVWAVAAFGAALGDILPGESSGDDINDQLADIGEYVTDEFD